MEIEIIAKALKELNTPLDYRFKKYDESEISRHCRGRIAEELTIPTSTYPTTSQVYRLQVYRLLD